MLMAVFTEGYNFIHASFFPSWETAVLLGYRDCRDCVHRKPDLCWPRIQTHLHLIYILWNTYICIYIHIYKIYVYKYICISCKNIYYKLQFSTSIPDVDVDHLCIVLGTFPYDHLFAITCFVQPPAKCFFFPTTIAFDFKLPAALIQRPTLSLAPALSGLFQDSKYSTPNVNKLSHL